PIECLTHTVRHEGVLGLYKGMASPLVGIAFVNAVLFSSYGWFKALLADPLRPDAPLSIPQIAVAGSGAGIINSFVAGPIELFKIRLQAQYSSTAVPNSAAAGTAKPVYSGPVAVARALVKDHGWIRGCFHGTWATIVREIPAYAGFYGGFEYAKRALRPTNSDPSAAMPVSRLMLAGSFGGIMYWTCSYPLDVAKSRIQRLSPDETSQSVWKALRTVHAEAGMRGLFAGYVTSVVRTIPAGAATFTVYELTMRAIG
ncbi:hypothetical protein HK405_011152, partial [Cladochytrium tenue]